MNTPEIDKSSWPKTTIDVSVNPDWIDYILMDQEAFDHRGYAGYWCRTILWNIDRGWLLFEHECEIQRGQEPLRALAIEAWQLGKHVPKGFFHFGRNEAIKAWGEGVKLYGMDWYEKADSTSYDCVLQMTLLGELRYG